MYQNPDLKNKLGSIAKNKLDEKFSKDKSIDSIIKVIENLHSHA
jgi:hypothetical protein